MTDVKKVFKAKDFEPLLKDTDGIEKMLKILMEDYNAFFDSLINAFETDAIMKKFDEAKDLWGQLEVILMDAGATSTRKKWWLLSRFIWDGKTPKNNMLTIKAKAENIIDVYNSCYDALSTSVAIQVSKGRKMDEFEKYFCDARDYVEWRLNNMPRETWEEQIMHALLSSFLVNLKKMIITMRQKMMVMQWTINSSMELRSEMSQNKHYFEWLIKDLVISISLDNIVNAASTVVNSFRGIIEKHNERLAKNMMATANDVADIKKHWIQSVESMQSMGEIIIAAGDQYKALGQQYQSHRAIEDKAMNNIETWNSKMQEAQSIYLNYNNNKNV